MERLRAFGLKLMEIKRLHDETKRKASEYKALMDRTENAILSMLKAAGINRVQVDDPENDAKYTFSQGGGVRYSIDDYSAFIEYVKTTGDFSLFTKAVSRDGVRDYREAHSGDLPPGVIESAYEDLSVRTTRVPAED